MRTRLGSCLIASIAVLALSGCGDAGRCGLGTHSAQGLCEGNAPLVCGPGTVASAGECVPVTTDPCGPGTEWDATAGYCVPAGLCPTPSSTTRAVRWTGFQLTKPESIATIANLQLPQYFADGTIVVLLEGTTDPAGGILLRGGTGTKTSDAPLTYTFVANMTPTDVHATVTGAGAGAPFATDATVDWSFMFLPGQPPLDVRHVALGGTLDADGLPTSAAPPLGGSYRGCITSASADLVYISALQTYLGELIRQNGGALDCDATGGGSNDGYALEASWDSDEIPAITGG